MIEAGKSMPDSIEMQMQHPASNPARIWPGGRHRDRRTGTKGLCLDERGQQKNIFDTTYEELVAYFGVEGLFEKEEYSDHMKANYRYYKWISADNDSHFIYVNFKEEETGVYEVSAYNTSGFSARKPLRSILTS